MRYRGLDMNKLKLTSNLIEFEQQLLNPNSEFHVNNLNMKNDGIKRLKKNYVLSFVSDPSGCGHIRNVFPMSYLNAQFGKTGKFNLILSPIPTFEPEILLKSRTLFFQRWMAPERLEIVRRYKTIQQKLKYRMVFDIDDFIWKGDEEGEYIPEYNFGSDGIDDNTRKSCVEIMNLMDIVCVSTEFLKEYIGNKLGVKNEIIVLPNAIPKFFWGDSKKNPISEKIKFPKVIYTGSPTHYHNPKRLKGDWNNEWVEWVIKNVKDKKIQFVCMGGLPFFFESIKNCENFKIINWINSFQYHLAVRSENADFGIAPLVPNFFNYSKSDLKHIEYCAGGILSIGTVFRNGKSSPYDNNIVKTYEDITVEEIDEIFDQYTEPDQYNDVIQKQYDMLDKNGRWLESPQYVKRLLQIF